MFSGIWTSLFILLCCSPEGPPLVKTSIPYPPEYDVETVLKDWPLFLTKYCGRMCRNGNLIERDPNANDLLCPLPACYPCDCDKYCSFKGTCCPTVDKNVGSYDLVSSVPDYLKGMYPRLECQKLVAASTLTKHLSISTCPKDWKDVSVKDNCENVDNKIEKSLVPYIDEDSGIVFQNIFCVYCNGFYHFDIGHLEKNPNSTLVGNDPAMLKALPLAIECLNGNDVLHATNNAELLDAGCNTYIPSIEGSPIECPDWVSSFHDTSFDLKMSSTGDDRLKKLCTDLPHLPALRINGNKNIFCHLYEGRSIDYVPCSKISIPNSPFDLLWKVPRTDLLRRTDICSTGRWETEKGKCITASCSAGKILDEMEKTCQTALTYAFELDYTLDMVLGIRANETSLRTYVEEQGTYAGDYFVNTLLMSNVEERGTISSEQYVYEEEYDVSFKIRVSFVQSCHNKGEIDIIAHFKTNNGRDEFEASIISVLTKKTWEVFERNVFPICIGTDACGLYRSETRDVCFMTTLKYIENRVIYLPNSAIDLTPKLVCPYIEVIPKEAPRVDHTTSAIYFTIELQHQEVQIKWNTNMSFVDGQLQICIEYFNDIYFNLEASASPSNGFSVISTVNYYLEIVCMCLSCVLLLATIVTYLLFPSLRTTPGLNTLCLCASLLPANVSLLVASLAGTRGLLPKPYCLFHAIFLHYSWIASFVWMNTCCIHMYRVFTGHRTGSKKKHFLWYCLYSFGSPCIVVMLVVIITYTTTDGASIGYSMDICFLDTSVSVLIMILGILVPLCVTVLINSVLFILTIKEMFSIKKMQQQTKSRHGVWTYTKLSTVTGLFCLLSAAGAQFDDVILSLLATPFSALQGLFVFVSFMANKRIYGMYSQMMFKRRHNTPNSSKDIL